MFKANCSPGSSQRGISMLFALLALAALALAAVGLVRTVGTGSLVVGNLSFKRDATASADLGAEQAIAWLTANNAGTGLDADVTAQGYYATSYDDLDPTGQRTAMNPRAVIDWAKDSTPCSSVSGTYSACLSPSAAVAVGSNTVSWVVTRLCSTSGSSTATSNSCAMTLNSGPNDDANSSGLDYSQPGGLGGSSVVPYYRVIVRTTGARSTVSFTETIVHF